ncbi:MAG: hypothetical protein PHY30_03675 [Candidatus Pacebacteria bacterium]|nr:hypothetical protein [Candidatus Paceibacterota bacterium]
MIDNIELLEFCFENKEPYIDKYYVKNNKKIITDSIQKKNALMLANIKILDNISTYKIAMEAKNKEMQKVALENIMSALGTVGINFSEFTSYWAVKDISYSFYEKKLKTDSLKLEFLKNIIPQFIKDRHLLYKNYGYSFSTLQAVSDSKSHKKNGNAGFDKVSNLLNTLGLKRLNSKNLEDFNRNNNIYICPDKMDKFLFKEIVNYYDLKFKWSKKHENKQIDFLIKINNDIFIIEHKHMKEPGGGQDKQMTEIIDFISHKEKNSNIHYVSFLDGIYFNLLADKEIRKGKPYMQRRGIYKNLKNNKLNYFVNTEGFIKLVKAFIY